MVLLKKLPSISWMICLFIGAHTIAQPSMQHSLDSLAGAVIQHLRNSEPQQSYIVTDKSIYQTGETIWARAFLLKSYSNRISTSHSIIAELVNEKDSTIRHLLLDAANQQLTAKILLPSSLATGFYWLRVYTVEMIHKDSVHIYSRPVYVINPRNPAIRNKTDTANAILPIGVTFFPEGGSIMTGTNSVIAYHITDNRGNPVKVSGYIKDNRDSIVARFSSNELGIGKMEFFPYRARRYTATIRYDGKDYVYPLPKFNFHAGQVAITGSQKEIKHIRVLLEDSIYNKNFVTYLIGVSRDSVCFAGIGRGNYELNIPTNQFPKGIATLYLFNQHNQLMSSRNFFVEEENVNATITLDKPEYSKRSKSILTVAINDNKHLVVPYSLSISVSAQPLIAVDQSGTIHTALYGQDDPMIQHWAIESAGTLPDSTLELLMLTKRAAYTPFISSLANTNTEENLLFLQGKLIVPGGKSAANKVVTLYAQGRSMVFETATTDHSGTFRIPIENYPDSTRFNLQVSDAKGKPENIQIVIDTFKLPRPVAHHLYPEFNVQPAIVSGYADKWESAFSGSGKEWLEPVLVKSKRNNDLQYESKRVSPSSFIIPASSFEKGGNSSVKNAVMRVPGLAINQGYLIVRGLNSTTAVTANAEPIVVMNGIVLYLPGADINGVSPVLNFLNSLNASDIEFMEVLRGSEGAAYGTRGGNGVIVIHTSNNVNVEPDSKSNIKTFYARGYHNPALFQFPNYSIKELKSLPNKDSRSTLYWNGNILTDEKGKIEIPFYTNDVAGTYKVVVQGISVHGDIIYKSVEFTVK